MDKEKALEICKLIKEIKDLEHKKEALTNLTIDIAICNHKTGVALTFCDYDEIQPLLLNLVTKELEQLNKQLEEL